MAANIEWRGDVCCRVRQNDFRLAAARPTQL
jgi:hypothetical protein